MFSTAKPTLIPSNEDIAFALDVLGKALVARQVTEAPPTPPRRFARGSDSPVARTSQWLGDAGPTQDLMDVVLELVQKRAMPLQELVRITGARRNRISGAIARMQRAGIPIENRGNGRIARWYLPKQVGR